MFVCEEERAHLFKLRRNAIPSPYTHTYIHTYIHTHIHTYIHTHIHTYTHACIHTHTHTYIHTYRHTYIHTYIHAFIHTYIHTYMHTYIHTHVHTYIHTYYSLLLLLLDVIFCWACGDTHVRGLSETSAPFVCPTSRESESQHDWTSAEALGL